MLALHQATMRTGWIFKTESIVMPAVLDVLSGAAWVRGLLPTLNRIGQSVPPILAASFVSALPRKKFFLVFCSAAMGLIFLVLAGIWNSVATIGASNMTVIFLALYLIFFVGVGLHQLALGTINGKLVPANRRGALLVYANIIGGISAITCAWLLMSRWLARGADGFFHIFIFAGITFLLAGICGLLLRERSDSGRSVPAKMMTDLRATAARLRTDRDFRNLAVVAMLFGASYTLFPHYQSLGKTRLELGLGQLVPWLIAQNIGVSLFSIPVGWIADRYGNRITLRGLFLASTLAPVLAVILSQQTAWGSAGFTVVFLLLGLMPITMRVIANFALELADPVDQPKFLSVTGLAMSIPVIFGSALVGLLIDLLGFDICFYSIVVLLVIGFFLTQRIREPRHFQLQTEWDASEMS